MIVHSYMMDFSEEILHNLLAAFGLSVLAILIGTVLTLAHDRPAERPPGPHLPVRIGLLPTQPIWASRSFLGRCLGRRDCSTPAPM